MIKGNVSSPKNLRSSPNDLSTTNIIGTIGSGSSFLGDNTSQDSKGRGLWIRIMSINGIPVVKETWLAGWVSSYEVIPDTIPEDKTKIPVILKLIEYFPDGTDRTTVWENPKLEE